MHHVHTSRRSTAWRAAPRSPTTYDTSHDLKIHLDTCGSRAQPPKLGARANIYILRSALRAHSMGADLSLHCGVRLNTTGYSILWPSVTACMWPPRHARG